YFPASKYYGMPDYMPALGAMALDRNAVIFNNSFFSNGGMLGMILFMKGIELNNESRLELKNMVQGNFTGVDNAHRMAIIDGLSPDSDWKIEKVMESVRDMSFYQLRKFNRDEILAAHHVPPEMIHVAEAGRLGESKDGYNQMKFFKIFEIDPSQRRHENIWNKLFRDELGVTKWKIKFKELDIRDPNDFNEEIWGDLEHFILDPDEAREMRGREPLEIEGELSFDVGAQVEEVGAALNLSGVQITAATKIVSTVSAGEIPRDSGKNQLMNFFNLDEGQAEALLGAAGTGKKVKPDKTTAPTVEKTIAKLSKYIEKLEDELLEEL
ncbi:phage portal protein, partial [bacterium]|nr:phage portal protein [bacterium]